MVKLSVNGIERDCPADPDTPLLWALREDLGLTGTKFGCGVGACGACTVHIDGEAVRSCPMPLSDVGAVKVTTIEALGKAEADKLHPVQQAWVEAQVPQCGYCQPGMIMAVAALLARDPDPSETSIREQITNICRCGTYPRIVAAVRQAAAAARA
ncbi:(2Fe-2S)-binding protein [Novosphingobium sp. CCH12-A3]|uniref:(2Fe-2S)-binding protein n=1 Tax=Novosphingobium sp. CCH12-A3 TaxID=1768752 RepID=UPI00078302B8|nr:(2Fe-2S)-binding protein [Novosphingobium sp. CCH12-A3]